MTKGQKQIYIHTHTHTQGLQKLYITASNNKTKRSVWNSSVTACFLTISKSLKITLTTISLLELEEFWKNRLTSKKELSQRFQLGIRRPTMSTEDGHDLKSAPHNPQATPSKKKTLH